MNYFISYSIYGRWDNSHRLDAGARIFSAGSVTDAVLQELILRIKHEYLEIHDNQNLRVKDLMIVIHVFQGMES